MANDKTRLRQVGDAVQVTVGQEKISLIVTRKTLGDKLVSQHSLERWFATPEAAVAALRSVLDVFVEARIDERG